MKALYSKTIDGRRVGYVEVVWDPDGDETFAIVAEVKVDPDWRRGGIATDLMERVCADADRLGITLMLYACALEEHGEMDSQRLRRWYGRRFGFDAPNSVTGYQWRQPLASEAAA